MTSGTRSSDGGWLARRGTRDLALLIVLAGLAWAGPTLGLRQAHTALLDLGPGDEDAIRGFRSEWERDGRTRFRWTLQASNLTFPLRAEGEGFVLRMRMRRHLVDPADVRLYVEGRRVASFEIQPDPSVPYRIGEFSLPPLQGRHPFVLSLESSSASPRPLGVALDWVELERDGSGRFAFPERSSLALLFAVVLAFAAPRMAGAGRPLSVALALLLLASAVAGAGIDPVATERIARLGVLPLAISGLLALVCVQLPLSRRWLGLELRRDAGILVALVILAFVVRAIILLHPRFFYPDVQIHGLFSLLLARRGFVSFLGDFIPNQFRYSLGLQEVGSHWYAFPYPPGFYVLAAPFVSLFHYGANAAVSVTAAIVNSLEILLVFAIGRHLGLSRGVGRAAAAFLVALPLFLTRLSLAYFPAIVGHALDAAVVAFLACRYGRLDRWPNATTLAGLLTLALLTYTQGLLNFGTLLGLFLLLEIRAERSLEARRRQILLATSAVLAAVASFGIFYVRYVPMLTAMARGEAVPEERIVLDIRERMRVPENERVPEESDPYAGPDLNPLRGLEKAAWRLWVFYGPFAPFVVVGVLLLIPSLEGYRRRLVIAWGATYVALNLASGGLPGPNLVRYNKDLEIVAPLCALGLGWLVVRAWESRRPAPRIAAVMLSLGWLAFATHRAYLTLTARLVLER